MKSFTKLIDMKTVLVEDDAMFRNVLRSSFVISGFRICVQAHRLVEQKYYILGTENN
jgi:hypothetical protein